MSTQETVFTAVEQLGNTADLNLDALKDISIVDSVACPAINLIPSGVKTLRDTAKWLGCLEAAITAPAATMVPKVRPVVEKEIFVSQPVKRSSSSRNSLWTADHPYHARVSTAKWLTNTSLSEDGYYGWSEEKQVIHMELSLEDSGMTYMPGDSIGICCPNPEYAVQVVLDVLRRAHPSKGLTLDSAVSCINFPSISTLCDLLSYGIDLVGCPKKVAVATLAQYCKDPEDAALLQNLSSKSAPGKDLWSNFVEGQKIGLAELLCLVPSCTPTISALLQCAVAMPPRFYSIASSPLRDSRKLAVAFSVVRYTCALASKSSNGEAAPEVRRKGVCTHHLLQVLKPWLCQRTDSSHPETRVRIFHKATITFQLPGSVGPPLILVGPGTGIAPFMGFLDHRALLEFDRARQHSGEDTSCGCWRGSYELSEDDLPGEATPVGEYIHSVAPGPIHMFFGCRNDNDYLYKVALAKHLSCGTLTSLEVAKSRVSEHKVYVTHKLAERGAEITRLLIDEGAYFFVCGDGNQMAKDVYATLKQILMRHSTHTTEEAADKVLEDLKHRRRYVLDIWS